jgi:mercuric ion transport protein
MEWRNHLDKIGVAGSFIAAACCLGLPAILSIIAAIGLGFIVNDAVLLPLLIIFLAVTLAGLWFGYRVHRHLMPLTLAGISAALVYVFIFVRTIPALAYLGIAGLIVASVVNVIQRRKCGPACET